MSSSPSKAPHPKAVLLNSMGFQVLDYLESQEGICDLELLTKDGVQSQELAAWEKKNIPCLLSTDLKSFFSTFNGLCVRWSCEVGEAAIPVGEIRINSLDAVIRIPIDGRFVTSELSQAGISPPDPQTCAAFLIDSSCEYGQVIIVFRPQVAGQCSGGEPEVWFQDLSARWHFISSTFKQYMRIMILHLGVIGWQMAFTSEGLPLSTQQWMRLYCKERLCVDLHNNPALNDKGR